MVGEPVMAGKLTGIKTDTTTAALYPLSTDYALYKYVMHALI